jgi:N-acetyl-alpha-D-glucosaminyl L-malate synthase BshA
MKIGIVCYPTFGGSGVVATELGKALAKKGHSIHFITYKRPARLNFFSENIFYHEVNTSQYPLFDYSPYDTALASKMVDVVLYEKLDLLHVHYAIPHASVAFLAKSILKTKGIDLPVITTLHGTDITLVGNDPSFSPVVEFSINSSDGVTAVSNQLKQHTHESFDIHNEIEVIYNFIDFERFKKTNKNHFKIAIAPNGEKIITHVSNFRKVKRIEDVIRVFEKVHKKVSSKLFLIGDGPERQRMEQLCREIGLCSEIRFMGKQQAVEDLLNISDLFIIPSANESFGLSALEAMACEVPVISSNAGGLPEVNIHGVTGYLSNIGDVDDMAENAIKILSDEKLHEKLKKGAYETSLNFHIDNILPQYEHYYSKIYNRVTSHNLIA